MRTRESKPFRTVFSLRRASQGLLLGVLVALAACREDASPEEAPEPHFSATVDGAVRYVMEGAAFYRVGQRRRLIGLELDRADGSGGLSFELDAAEPFARAYPVAGETEEAAPALEDDTLSTVTVFLADQDRDFTAGGGVLRIEAQRGSALYGAFELQMSGYLDDQDGDLAEITVSGTFTAVRESETNPSR